MFSPCSELVVFMYRNGKSMNNRLSYSGLVDPRISESDKDLPVMPEIYIYSASNDSNKTHSFMCLGRTGHFGQQ